MFDTTNIQQSSGKNNLWLCSVTFSLINFATADLRL